MADDFRPLSHPFRIPGPLTLIIVLQSDLHSKHFLPSWLDSFIDIPSANSQQALSAPSPTVAALNSAWDDHF